jgi:hypothetical protein
MNRLNALFLGVVAALMLLVSACVVADRGDYYAGGRDTYYYYPDDEVYFYPRVGEYYWYEGGVWRHDRRVPTRFVLRDRVRVDWNREPHLDHDRIRRDYPPRRDDRDRDRDRDQNHERERPRY